MNSRVAALALVLLLGSCDPRSEDERYDEAYENAADAVSDLSFEDVGSTADCTEDCSGHNAGFEWAKEQGVTDASECGGDSDSFIEGCEAYASAFEEAADEELEE